MTHSHYYIYIYLLVLSGSLSRITRRRSARAPRVCLYIMRGCVYIYTATRALLLLLLHPLSRLRFFRPASFSAALFFLSHSPYRYLFLACSLSLSLRRARRQRHRDRRQTSTRTLSALSANARLWCREPSSAPAAASPCRRLAAPSSTARSFLVHLSLSFPPRARPRINVCVCVCVRACVRAACVWVI